MGRLRDAAVHNTAQPEPKHENSNGVGPHSGARVPSAAQPERRSRSSNEEGPHSEHCRTQHSPAGTKARELKRGRAAFGRAGTFCGPAVPKASSFDRRRAASGTLPYTTRPNRDQSPRTQTGSGRIRNTAVHNTAQLEPKHESSDGDGPHSVARVPFAAQPERRSRTSNEEGPPSEHCHTQHGPAGTKVRELKRGRAAFGRAGSGQLLRHAGPGVYLAGGEFTDGGNDLVGGEGVAGLRLVDGGAEDHAEDLAIRVHKRATGVAVADSSA